MLKLFYALLTDPLGLPVSWIWEYIILAVLGWVVHEIAWSASPGGVFGSVIYWVTKFLAFVVIWAVLYILISIIIFISAHWVWFLCGVIIVWAISYWVTSR